jgi:hypothetical protein
MNQIFGSYMIEGRVAVNILNKQSRTADKGWSSRLGVGRGAATPHHKNFSIITKCFKVPQTWTDSLVQSKHWKKDMRFGTWYVRSLYRVGAIKSVVGELEKYKLDLVGVQRLGGKGRCLQGFGWEAQRQETTGKT